MNSIIFYFIEKIVILNIYKEDLNHKKYYSEDIVVKS